MNYNACNEAINNSVLYDNILYDGVLFNGVLNDGVNYDKSKKDSSCSLRHAQLPNRQNRSDCLVEVHEPNLHTVVLATGWDPSH